MQPRLKMNHKERRIYTYFLFEKEVDNNMKDCRSVISVDVNENNITIKVQNRVHILQTDIKKLTLGYTNYRELIQSIKSNKYVKRTIHNRERKRKK